jgi:hypothetical protein
MRRYAVYSADRRKPILVNAEDPPEVDAEHALLFYSTGYWNGSKHRWLTAHFRSLFWDFWIEIST